MPKNIASPYSTGGGGVSFEQQVGAYYLAAILLGDIPRGQNGGIAKEVKFQRLYEGEPLDDLIICSNLPNGTEAKLALQIKRDLTFGEKDEIFDEVISACWETFSSPIFNKNIDHFGIVISLYSKKVDEHYQTVLKWAKNSTSSDDFIKRINTTGLSNKTQRSFVELISKKLNSITKENIKDDSLWNFLRHMLILRFDFEQTNSSENRNNIISKLKHILVKKSKEQSSSLFSSLIEIACEANQTAGSHNEQTLRQKLQYNFSLIEAQTRSSQSKSNLKRIKKLNNLKKSSSLRCKRNWELNGLTQKEIVEITKDPLIKVLDASKEVFKEKLNIFIGDLGSGKSLTAERLFQKLIDQSLKDVNAPIPILIKAPNISGSLRELIIKYSKDIGDPEEEEFVLIVDEVDRLTKDITSIRENSLELAELYPNSTIILFSRPNEIFNPDENEKHRFNIVEIPALSEEDSNYLIQKISKINSIYLKDIAEATESIKDAIKKPFFAILLGVYFKQNSINNVDNISHLLSYLVEKNLGKEKTNEFSTQAALKKLAIKSIKWQGKPVPINEVVKQGELKTLLDSKIVVEKNGKLSFPLQIFTEWFAAISISEGNPTPEELSDDLQILESWKYPLAMAVTACSHEEVSKFLTPIIQKYPFFASEIIDLSLSIDIPNLLLNRWKEYGEQLREATQVWIDGITPPLLQKIYPIDYNGKIGTVGISMTESKFRVGWYLKDNIKDTVITLPKEGAITTAWGTRKETYINNYCYDSPPTISPPSAWAWKYSLDEIKKEISSSLQGRIFTTKDGLMAHEELWEAALIVIDYFGFSGKINNLRNKYNYFDRNKSIPLDFLNELLSLFNPEYSQYNNIKRDDILHLKTRINQEIANGNTNLQNPYLSRFYNYDFDSKSFTRNCSEKEIKEYIEYILYESMFTYKKIVEYLFPNFKEALYTYFLFPAELQGYCSRNGGISYSFLALPYGQDIRINLDFNEEKFNINSTNLRKYFKQLNEAVIKYRPHKSKSINGISIVSMSIKSVSDTVYDWLWEDLQKINWVKGSLGKPNSYSYNYKTISEKIEI